jgi:uncharacterized protein YukE
MHRCADVLRDRRTTLSRAEEALLDWRGAAGDAFRSAFRTQRRVLDDTAEALTTCAHALQEYSVDLQHARSLSVEAEDYCHRHGLELSDDGSVRMPWGAYTVEEADAYAERLPEGQRLASRAREEADDGARRLARRVDAPVHALGAARHAVLAAVQLATQAAIPTYR